MGENSIKYQEFLFCLFSDRFFLMADQLTLSQPGGHIIATQYHVPPQIFRPCDGPGW